MSKIETWKSPVMESQVMQYVRQSKPGTAMIRLHGRDIWMVEKLLDWGCMEITHRDGAPTIQKDIHSAMEYERLEIPVYAPEPMGLPGWLTGDAPPPWEKDEPVEQETPNREGIISWIVARVKRVFNF